MQYFLYVNVPIRHFLMNTKVLLSVLKTWVFLMLSKFTSENSDVSSKQIFLLFTNKKEFWKF